MKIKKNHYWANNFPVSVVILGHRRADLLLRAVKSLKENSINPNWELILVLNGASAPVLALAESWFKSEVFPLCIVTTKEVKPGAARNLGVKEAGGSILLFLDDDVECFQDLVGNAVSLFENAEIMAAGGPNLTPPQSGALERATGFLMGSVFGAGSMASRYRQEPDHIANEHSLILCNLAVRRSVFQQQGGFPLHLVSNEENVLLQKLEREGKKMISSSSMAVYHRRRDNFLGIWNQAKKYGSGRRLNLFLMPSTFHLIYFLPSVFLLYILNAFLFFPFLGLPVLFPLFFYLFVSFIFAFWKCIAENDLAALCMPFLSVLIHVGYGYGFLSASLAPFKQRKNLLEPAQ